jgi:MoxR-like ATPase
VLPVREKVKANVPAVSSFIEDGDTARVTCGVASSLMMVPVAVDVARDAVRLSAASRPKREGTSAYVNDWVSWGAGTRASQYLVLGGKTRALLAGRAHVTKDDIRAMALPVLRHRILVNYRAEAEGITVEKVIDELLKTVS